MPPTVAKNKYEEKSMIIDKSRSNDLLEKGGSPLQDDSQATLESPITV